MRHFGIVQFRRPDLGHHDEGAVEELRRVELDEQVVGDPVRVYG